MKESRTFRWVGGWVVALSGLLSVHAATISKTNNVEALNLGSSWVGGLAPGENDVAEWNSTVTGENEVSLGADLSWAGMRIANPGGAVTLASGDTLTLGASGIDMGSATTNLTVSSGLALLPGTRQLWNIAGGRRLTLDTGAFARGAGAVLLVQGSGSIAASSLTNDATGLVGPWACLGSGTATRFIAMNSGLVTNYTGTQVATAEGVTHTAGSANYELGAGGAFGAGASFHTLRYTGTVGTVSGAWQADGVLQCGSGSLTLSGPATIGASRELVVTLPSLGMTISGAISNHADDASALTKAGAAQLSLTGSYAFTGPLTIGEGTLQMSPSLNGQSLPGSVFLNSAGYLQYNSGNSLTLAGVVAGPGQIHKWNGGQLTLAGTNSYSGLTQIYAGVIRLANSLALGASAGGTQLRRFDDSNRGRVELNGFSTSEPFSFEDGGGAGGHLGWGGFLENNSSTGAVLLGAVALNKHGTFRGSGKIIVKAAVTGSANLVKDGTGTLEIDTNIVFAGGMVISNGLVHVTSNGRLGSGSYAGGILVTNVGSFFYNASTTQTLSGVISGNGAIEKWRTEGTLTLAGANTFAGGIKIYAGTVRLAHGSALGSAAGATHVKRHDDSNRGILDLNGQTTAEPLVFDDNAYAGSTLGYGGFLENNEPLTNATSSGAVSLLKHATVRGTGNLTLSGIISGAGRLVKQGTNTLTISGANTYTGATAVAAGTLRLGADHALPDASDVILSGGMLDAGSATDAAASLTVAASSTLALGSGRLTFGNSAGRVWSGTLTLTGTLGPDSLRFPDGLTLDQVLSMTHNGGRVYLTPDGFIVDEPPGTRLLLQ